MKIFSALSSALVAFACAQLAACAPESLAAPQQPMGSPPPPAPPPAYSAPTNQTGAHPFVTPEEFSSAQWTTKYAGSPLSLAGYVPTLSDNFSNCDTIGPAFVHPRPGVKWFAQHGGSGGKAGAVFADMSGPNNPYSCTSGHLMMTLSNPTGAKWQGAQISSINYIGSGYMQTQGYWEVSAMLPPPPQGLVPWASVWFESGTTQPNHGQSNETDMFESGLLSPTDSSVQVSTIHRWPGKYVTEGLIKQHASRQWKMPINIFDGRVHRYGYQMTRDWQILYFDRRELVRFPILADDQRTPMAMLIDITTYFPPTVSTSTRYTMNVYQAGAWTCPGTRCP